MLFRSRDAVRVMTIHASKGLEFPVVVLMEIDAKAKRSGSERALPSRLFGVVSSKLPRFSPTSGLQKEMKCIRKRLAGGSAILIRDGLKIIRVRTYQLF